jgi:phosphopantetheinyl transferase
MSCVPIIKQSELSVYLMETDDSKRDTYLSSLTGAEMIRFETIHHPAKQLEYAASRYLRTTLFGLRQIYYSEIGAPYMEEAGYISLSHTHGLVGLAHSPAFSVGLDLETIREKAVKLGPKFMHPSEISCFDPESPFDMSLLWSFKETLFKLAGRRGVHFSTDLIVRKVGDRYFGVINQYHQLHEYELTHQLYGHYLITCNAGKEQIDEH